MRFCWSDHCWGRLYPKLWGFRRIQKALPRFFCCFVKFLGHKNHSKYRRLRDLYAWPRNWRSHTRDLETKGHVMVYVTHVISACICPTAMNFLLFRNVLGQGIHSNYCHLRDSYVWPWNWRSRHGLRDVRYFCLYVSYRDDWWILFCFVRFLGQGIHSNYCHLRDHHVWPWNSRSRHDLRDLTT